MIIALSSCSSDDGFSDGTFEDASSMSEVTLEEGAIPPWFRDYDDGSQINAGPRTPSYNGNETAKLESKDDSGLFGQNQSIANNEEAIVLEPPPGNPFHQQFGDTKPGKIIGSTTTKKPKPRTRPRIKKPTIIIYKVKKGDNLSVIAHRSGTTVAAIRRTSGIKGSLIYAGQTIKVPYTPKGYKASKTPSTYRGKTTTYTVRSGDSISVIAARYGTSTSAVLRANNMSNSQARSIRPGQKIKVPSSRRSSSSTNNSSSASSEGKGYTIQSGDTLSEIASKNGVSTSALMKANSMDNNDARRLRPGQKIIIP